MNKIQQCYGLTIVGEHKMVSLFACITIEDMLLGMHIVQCPQNLNLRITLSFNRRY